MIEAVDDNGSFDRGMYALSIPMEVVAEITLDLAEVGSAVRELVPFLGRVSRILETLRSWQR